MLGAVNIYDLNSRVKRYIHDDVVSTVKETAELATRIGHINVETRIMRFEIYHAKTQERTNVCSGAIVIVILKHVSTQ